MLDSICYLISSRVFLHFLDVPFYFKLAICLFIVLEWSRLAKYQPLFVSNVSVYKGGSSITRICNTLKVNKSTIYYIIQRWKLNGSTNNSTGSGRPSLISKRGCRQLKES